MPFLVYERKSTGKDHNAFFNPKRTTRLPAVMKQYVQQKADQSHGYTWHLDEATILELLGQDPESRALVVDLKPSQKKAVSLYRISDFWGFSDPGWTPLLVRFEALFVDWEHDNPASFKQSFRDLEASHEQVHEFLYVQFGTERGTANWGRSGWVNATLLWPAPLRYFMGIIQHNLEPGSDFS